MPREVGLTHDIGDIGPAEEVPCPGVQIQHEGQQGIDMILLLQAHLPGLRQTALQGVRAHVVAAAPQMIGRPKDRPAQRVLCKRIQTGGRNLQQGGTG